MSFTHISHLSVQFDFLKFRLKVYTLTFTNDIDCVVFRIYLSKWNIFELRKHLLRYIQSNFSE